MNHITGVKSHIFSTTSPTATPVQHRREKFFVSAIFQKSGAPHLNYAGYLNLRTNNKLQRQDYIAFGKERCSYIRKHQIEQMQFYIFLRTQVEIQKISANYSPCLQSE